MSLLVITSLYIKGKVLCIYVCHILSLLACLEHMRIASFCEKLNNYPSSISAPLHSLLPIPFSSPPRPTHAYVIEPTVCSQNKWNLCVNTCVGINQWEYIVQLLTQNTEHVFHEGTEFIRFTFLSIHYQPRVIVVFNKY